VFALDALSANLAPSLDLLAEYIRRPAFDADDLERVRAQRVAAIRQEIEDPGELLKRVLYPAVYGSEHPYGIPPSGLGEDAAVMALGTDDLRAFHDKWLRPDLATIYIVGDTSLAEATALLERSFGDWRAPAAAAPVKNYDVAIPTPQPRIVLIDTPGAPQAIIRAVRVLDNKGTDDLLALRTSSEVFGGGSLSRMFQEVRQARGWSYSPAAFITVTEDRPLFIMHAPVQTDKTGETVKLMRELIGAYGGDAPVTAEEARRAIESNRRSLPAALTTNAGLLNTLIDIDQFERPDTYYETLGAAYSGLDAGKLAAEARRELRGDQLVFFIVGDRSEIEPQLQDVGLPVEYREADEF
jgi:predicted Zn-dependent peptidase